MKNNKSSEMNPDTNKCPHCGANAPDKNYMIYDCGTSQSFVIKDRVLAKGGKQSPLCREREARQNAEADYKDTLALLERRNGEIGKAETENQKLRSLCNRYRYVIETEFDAWSIPCRGLIVEHDALIHSPASTIPYKYQ